MSVGSREIMIDAFVDEKLLNGGIYELGSIVTSDSSNTKFNKNFNSFMKLMSSEAVLDINLGKKTQVNLV